ncbi:MAG: TRAP transporter large permease subunit, partial [Bacillota bacterium]|nr:TRAP transporter large permease subunit [Bacillota bacterium]
VWMLSRGNSPMKAGFWAILVTIALSYIDKKNRLSFLDILQCLEEGVKNAVPVIIACGAAGIIVGSISLTGLGIRFSRFAIQFSGGNLFLMLFMIMFASIILGMGMPTSSAYIVLAVLGTPPLINLGVNVVSAHLFVLYFGIISGLTPPVAITAYTAAGIANSQPNETALLATKIGIGGFLLPFMFAINPELVLQNSDVLKTVIVVLTSFIGCIGFAAFMQGYFFTNLKILSRIFIMIASIMLVNSNLTTDLIALLILGVITFKNYKDSKKILNSNEAVS